MKAQIRITGQIGSISTISRKMNDYESKEDGRFNAIILNYPTIGAAKSDIKRAYAELFLEAKSEGHSTQHITKYADNSGMSYGAGKAEINTAE